MPIEVINVHVQDTGATDDLRRQIVSGLSQPAGHRELPTMLLYDEYGLRLYDDITTEAPEYYLFGAEEEILKNHAGAIVSAMHHRDNGSVHRDEAIVELGAGALRKTSHILLALAELVTTQPSSLGASTPLPGPGPGSAPITYYALDLEERELIRTLSSIENSDIGTKLAGKVVTKGMWGTYDSGLQFIQSGGIQAHRLGEQMKARGSSSSTPKLVIAAEEAGGGATVAQEELSSPTDEISSSESSGSAHSDTASEGELSSSPSTPDGTQPPLHIMFLGSSLGNFARGESAGFLRDLPLRPGSRDTLLLGADHANGKEMIEVAYNDPKGYTRKFIMNGLRNAGRTMGDEGMFEEEKWEYVNEYDVTEREHRAFLKSKEAQSVAFPGTSEKVSFEKDELLRIEESLKFSELDAYTLFSEANLRPIQRWTDSTNRYSLWLLERPAFIFPLLSSPLSCTHRGTLIHKRSLTSLSNRFGAPAIEEWENLWTLWDCITMQMIPRGMLYVKPIDLRHICLFYLGHIPTFLDIHLSRLLGEGHTQPEEFKYIFERGIDPNVDDPTQCHSHSEVPLRDEDWPSLPSIVQFKRRVRSRLADLYDKIHSGELPLSRKIARVLFMTYEHEAMHAETLLYMLLQRAGTVTPGTQPPLGFTSPPWEALSESWDTAPKLIESTVTLGPEEVAIGHDDSEADDTLTKNFDTHEFGWDNESPRRVERVGEFRIEWRPVTNGEFWEFYERCERGTVEGVGKGAIQFPTSWVKIGGETRVRTLYGPVPIKVAQHWPVITSYNNLSIYATVKGGRIPTEPELRLFYDRFSNGYDGGENWGLRNWHPVPATTGQARSGGRGTNGGVWEWTSTTFAEREGFVPSVLYPGYSADFFDGHHNVVLGGSYATVPRIAERRSFRNWYQKNYPYAFIGARVAYDC